MAYRGMSAQQREICEFLALNPSSTSVEICAGTGYPYDAVKKKLRVLKESGHVQGSDSNYRSSYRLTEKPFPRRADYKPNPRHLARKERLAARVNGGDPLFAAMHAMVMVGRAAA